MNKILIIIGTIGFTLSCLQSCKKNENGHRTKIEESEEESVLGNEKLSPIEEMIVRSIDDSWDGGEISSNLRTRLNEVYAERFAESETDQSVRLSFEYDQLIKEALNSDKNNLDQVIEKIDRFRLKNPKWNPKGVKKLYLALTYISQ